METQPINMMAWTCTSGGEAKVDRPIANCVENPATITRAIEIAAPRKKRSSPASDAEGLSMIVSNSILDLLDRSIVAHELRSIVVSWVKGTLAAHADGQPTNYLRVVSGSSH